MKINKILSYVFSILISFNCLTILNAVDKNIPDAQVNSTNCATKIENSKNKSKDTQRTSRFKKFLDTIKFYSLNGAWTGAVIAGSGTYVHFREKSFIRKNGSTRLSFADNFKETSKNLAIGAGVTSLGMMAGAISGTLIGILHYIISSFV